MEFWNYLFVQIQTQQPEMIYYEQQYFIVRGDRGHPYFCETSYYFKRILNNINSTYKAAASFWIRLWWEMNEWFQDPDDF